MLIERWGSYPSVEMQSAYSLAPAEWAEPQHKEYNLFQENLHYLSFCQIWKRIYE